MAGWNAENKSQVVLVKVSFSGHDLISCKFLRTALFDQVRRLTFISSVRPQRNVYSSLQLLTCQFCFWDPLSEDSISSFFIAALISLISMQLLLNRSPVLWEVK